MEKIQDIKKIYSDFLDYVRENHPNLDLGKADFSPDNYILFSAKHCTFTIMITEKRIELTVFYGGTIIGDIPYSYMYYNNRKEIFLRMMKMIEIIPTM